MFRTLRCASLASLSLCVLATACHGDDAPRDEDEPDAAAIATTADASFIQPAYAGDGGTTDAGPTPSSIAPAFTAFSLPLAQTVTVGAFTLQLEEARFEVPANTASAMVKVTVPFKAHNRSGDAALPLDSLASGETLFLLPGDRAYSGQTRTNGVPAGLDGTGSITWTMPLNELGLMPSDTLRQGTLRLGGGETFQVKLPLSSPADAVTLNDEPIATTLSLQPAPGVTATLDTLAVTYNFADSNEIRPADAPALQAEVALTAAQSFANQYWGERNFVLIYPDGTAVTPECSYLATLHYGKPVTGLCMFRLPTIGRRGTYTLSISPSEPGQGPTGPAVTAPVVVP